jgi:hypothetical protein
MDNNKKNDSGHAGAVIAKNFEFQLTENITLDEIKALLAERIRYLLDTNMEKLLSILYRIDVSQKITDEVFGIESKEDIPLRLADAVIERQLEKMKSRERYKKHGS